MRLSPELFVNRKNKGKIQNRSLVYYVGLLVVGLYIMLCLPSCVTYKNVPYFHDFADTARPGYMESVPFKNPVIQSDDILTITVQVIDNTVTSVLTSSSANPVPTASYQGQQIPNGYLVDSAGNVDIPFAGKVKVAGLTTSQAKDVLETVINKFFNNAIVNVRFANFKISMLGEVERPASYVLPNEKVNLFDALAMAGDMTVYGDRENVLLLRDSATGKKMVRLNVNNKGIVSSPYFFLRPNDILYVGPTKNKVVASDAVTVRNLTYALSGISLISLLVSVLRK